MNLFIIFLTVLAIGCAIWSILCICICLYKSTVYEKSVLRHLDAMDGRKRTWPTGKWFIILAISVAWLITISIS